MEPPMKRLFLWLAAMSILLSFSAAAQTGDSTGVGATSHARFDPRRDPEKDLKDALVLARSEHKLILLDVGGEWCIWCHRLDSAFVRNKDLDTYLNEHYVVVKVNFSKENKNTDFLSKYPKIEGYPHLFVLDIDGKLLCSQDTGELEYPEGYPQKGHDKQKIFVFLRKWAER